jgi:NitT/TauT family transport system substrate-binding protein
MKSIVTAAVVAAAALSAASAHADEKVRLIISTQQGFELFAPEEALIRGYFKEEGLDVTYIYGDGGTASVQAVITGSSDIIIGTGSMGVMAAATKGAPIKIIANGRRGVGEVFWYVPANSPIKKLQDLKGKTLAYSRPGSTTFIIGNFMNREHNLDAKMVSVGGMAASRTQAMSGQLDTGWSAAPVGLELARKGEVRIVATGDDVKGLADYSIRVSAANADWLAKNRETAIKFQRAFWKGMLSLYNTDEGIKHFGDRWGLDFEDAKRSVEFTPLRDVTYAPVGNVDGLIKLALEYDMLKEPLSEQQKKELIDVIYDPGPIK